MRVISGTARKTQLKTIQGLETRPTTDRIKETLYNIIAFYIKECVFLDLFAGSGAIGIEALSRGAKNCIFVENNIKAVECINSNLIKTNLKYKAQVIKKDVMSSLEQLNIEKQVFDIIFLDPPYNKQLEKQVILYLENSHIIDKDTIVITEASIETDFSYIENTKFEIYKIKEYKTNKHIFMRLRGIK